MSESQSRYSIVERLTRAKLDIISAKANLDSDVKVTEQEVISLKEDLKDWENNVKSATEKDKRDKQREIKRAERNANNCKDKKKVKENSYNEKVKAIDEALGRIEKISETAPAN